MHQLVKLTDAMTFTASNLFPFYSCIMNIHDLSQVPTWIQTRVGSMRGGWLTPEGVFNYSTPTRSASDCKNVWKEHLSTR